MILHPRSSARRAASRTSRTVLRHAVKALCEQLETRRLLVTLHGGDVMEFQDYNGIVRVKVDGPTGAQFELIGATSAPDAGGINGQAFSLNDIPSHIVTSGGTTIDELGGVGGANGVNPIGTVTGGDSLTDLFNSPGGAIQEAPSAGITFANLSSNSKGVTWGLNLVQTQGTTQQKLLELANFDYRNSSDATVYANLAPRIVQLTGAKDTTSIVSVFGCDFLPTNDNLLYIGVTVNVPRFNAVGTQTTPTDSPIPFLFVYNFATSGPAALNFANPNQDEFESQSLPGNQSFADLAPTVLGFSFASDDTLVAMVTGKDVTGTGDASGISSATGIVSLPDPNNPVFRIAQSRINPLPLVHPVTLDLKPVNDLHGLEVIPGDDGFVYGISAVSSTGNSTAELLHVQLTGANAGEAIDYGPLVDPQDNRAVKRGASLGDLDWNPVLVNPFHDQGVTGHKGLLMSEDTVTDELVVVDQRERFPQTNLFAIYGTNTTSDTSISIARVPGLTVPVRPMEPYTGTAGPIRFIDAQTGLLFQGSGGLATPGGTVFIGALTRNLIPDSINHLEDNIPMRRIKKTPSQTFGNLPKTTKYVYAGITILGNVHNVLIGGTVTGNVDIEGSADLLYAGDWLTGDAAGVLQLDDLSDDINGNDVVGNVFIHGDVRSFVSGSAIGSTGDGGLDRPTYLTGFNMNVGGRLGQITAPSGDVMGSVYVSNTFAGSSATQEEIEDKRGDTPGASTYFQGLDTGDAPSLGDPLTVDADAASGTGGNPQGPTSNDTFATAQYLATAQNNSLGTDEGIVVNGQIAQEPKIDDLDDYYAVALLAGQTVTVQLSSGDSEGVADAANVGVFDPDQRLIASDHPDQGLASDQAETENYVSGQPFRFTADRPGAYRFAIGFSDDAEFNGTNAIFDRIKYTLRITGVDNLALGGVVAANNIFTWQPGIPGISVHTGDLGAVTAGAAIFDDDVFGTATGGGNGNGVHLGGNAGGNASTAFSDEAPSDTWLIARGNFRALEAPTVGLISGNTFGDGVNFLVPKGTVGLTRADAPPVPPNSPFTAILEVNFWLPVIGDNQLPDPDFAAGGQWQLADSTQEFASNVSADGPIGSIRTFSMTPIEPPNIIANADRAGSDGVVDLIDVTQDMGTSVAGGPNIFTGPGGNVRYMRAGGTVYNSRKFGAGQDEPVIYTPGTTAKLTDDSGTPIKITPTPLIVNSNYDPTDGSAGDAQQYLNPGQLSIQTYSTADATKGGVVIMKVQIDSNQPGTGNLDSTSGGFSAITGNHGIEFNSGAEGNLASVEIGEVDTFETTGTRQITELDPGDTLQLDDGSIATNDTNQPEFIAPGTSNNDQDQSAPDDTTPVSLDFHGKSRIDVWSIVARDKQGSVIDDTTNDVSGLTPEPLDQVENSTDGEIVNVDASSIDDISAQWLGIARSHTGVDKSQATNAVQGVTVLDDSGTTGGTDTTAGGGGETPFVQQRNLIHVHGDPTSYLVTAHARKGIGNIWVEGIIGNIVADSNGKSDAGGGFEGIDGPIVSTPGATDTIWDARIEDVDIGQGIAYGGSGDVPYAGIFGGDTIGRVHGEGVDHDIYGIIHAGSDSGVAFNPKDGYTIGAITLDGGSIINADIGITDDFNNWRNAKGGELVVEVGDTIDNPIYDIGQISLKGVGGIIGSVITGSDIGPIKINGGFGFINSEVDSLSNNQMVGVDTTGYGIRGSRFFGGEDMQEMIARGTGKTISVKSYAPSVLTSAVDGINPFTGRAPDQLTDLYKALGVSVKKPKKKSISNSGVIENTLAVGGRDLGKVSAYQIRGRGGSDTEFDFSDATGTIALTGGTDEFTLNTGRLNKFTTGANIDHTLLGVAGPITQVNIGGTLKGTAHVLATGPDGTISSVHTKNALFGEVNATIGIGTIAVGTDLGSPTIATIGNLDLLEINGSMLDGAIVSNLKNGTFVPLRKIVDLVIGGDVQAGATIRAKAIGKQQIGGTVSGNIIIG